MFSSNQSNVAASVVANYIEEVFSTYLYTGTGATQTITNNIDLSTKGGLVWIKSRSAAWENKLTDTARGVTKGLISNSTGAETTDTTGLTTFNTTGFVLGANTDYNYSGGSTYVSWTFREQPKFFDVVTYTGNGSLSQDIAHNLGSVPGCVIIKQTASSSNWFVYHRGNEFAPSEGLALNLTASTSSTNRATLGVPTSTTFSAYFDKTNVNNATYVAYLFAHNAGGFGLTGTDNVISCGYAAGDTTVNLGWEPQWVLTKNPNSASNWLLVDNMRGMPAEGGGAAKGLLPNSSAAESDWGGYVKPTSTGFYNGVDAIYIAIRRGPMKVPTLGTSVFSPVTRTGTGATATGTAGFAPDLIIPVNRPHDYSGATPWFDKLRGNDQAIYSNATTAEETRANTLTFSNTGVTFGTNAIANSSGASYVNWYFQRAPGFFDEVCYTGDGTGVRAINHNLGVTPTFIIEKPRSNQYWVAYHSLLTYTGYLLLPLTGGADTDSNFWGAAPTSSTFSVGSYRNAVSENYVNYLFATCAGVSKVGSYTGTGTTLQIDCGFTGGARFVLIKRTDSGSTGDWYVWDTARGIVSGNDPYLLINSTAAEVTSTDYIDTYSAGFEISSTAPAAINSSASGATYIFLAIA